MSVVGGEIFLNQTRVECVALGGLEIVAERHLAALYVGTDDGAIHRPVERAELR